MNGYETDARTTLAELKGHLICLFAVKSVFYGDDNERTDA